MPGASLIGGIAWDVPVRLVPRREAGPLGAVEHHRVDAGHVLPGVVGLDVTTVRAGGVELLHAITLTLEGDASSAMMARDLATLLDGLRTSAGGGPDGAVGVLVEGSAFSRAVLEALSRVPVGARMTYAELAAAAGRPRAVRAAATVMARNRTPLVLPCHRIVPSSGGVGRYAWGAEAKAALLAAESAGVPSVVVPSAEGRT